MESYYLGGYYLVRLRPLAFGTFKFSTVYTCSNCINDNLIDHWAYNMARNNVDIKQTYNDLQIDGQTTIAIREWVEEKFEQKDIGWINVFNNLEAAKLYKQKFFSHLDDVKIFAVYFNANEANDLLDEFELQDKERDGIGLYQNLIKKIPETQSSGEMFIGFDLIGIELDGGFHSFHCHNITEDLTNKFGVEINRYGLLNERDNWTPILDYMNDETTGLEPVPWFSAKIKLVTE